MAGMTYTISPLSAPELSRAVEDLAALLADAVEDGASIGFLAPVDRDALVRWWQALLPSVTDGQTRVWAARDEGGALVGTVQLKLTANPNGTHRAQVGKLIVDRRARGRGLGRELLAVAEGAAVGAKISLLLLDTRTGSAAERLYASAGWTAFGIVPDYAADPDGTLSPCTFFYKQIRGA
jgi:ribosomal protein S18 acetylase RimI-like enzyme